MARGSEDSGLLVDGGVELLKIKRGHGQSSFEFEWTGWTTCPAVDAPNQGRCGPTALQLCNLAPRFSIGSRGQTAPMSTVINGLRAPQRSA